MSELQRLSTQAEVMPLMRDRGGLTLSREGKQLLVALRQAAADGVLQKAQIAILNDITRDAMDSVADIDSYRKALAGDDQLLNMLLGEVELNHVNLLKSIQRPSAF
ncbi:MAG TPA: hypothetical protein VHX38_17405 [Pseudonocardiaceae bacterium]|jgi:hypothetical protein|nr:hypothetical protein [Pseudonocardiaceae bacterium]